MPKPGAVAEDEGWLLTWLLNAEAHVTEVAILNAQRLGDGPLAVLRLQHVLPAVSHTEFTALV